jgi:Tol biopolymer transport system component
VPSGHLVGANADGHLVAVAYDPAGRSAPGDPIVIAREVQRSRYGTMHFAAAPDGALYWVPDANETRRDELVWVSRDGDLTPATSHLRAYETPSLSPDGNAVAVGARDAQDSVNIWLLDLVRDTLRPLTVGAGYSRYPLWSRRDSEVLFSVPLGSEELTAGIYRLRTDDRAAPVLVVPGTLRVPTSVGPEGADILFSMIGGSSGWDVWRAELGSGEVAPLLTAPFAQAEAKISPDGEWVAFETDHSGRPEIYIRGIGRHSAEAQVSPHGGRWPVWSPTGRELFYIGRTHLMSVAVNLGETPSAEPARELFAIGELADSFDVSRDGSRFLMIRPGPEPAPTRINVAIDWTTAVEPAAGNRD